MTNSSLSPEEARAALAEVDRRKHSAVDAAYDTPQWYFLGLGGLLVAFSGVYVANGWIEEHLGFAVSVAAFVLGIALFAGCLAVLAGLTVKRQRATPTGAGLGSRRDVALFLLAAAVFFGALFGVAFTVIDDNKNAVALSLVVVGLVIAVGGRPFQRLVRRRAHRLLDEKAAR